jgi:LDH2 family malate/lactate/ureidoglycolate dehydrogenase
VSKIKPAVLEAWIAALLSARGMPPADAAAVAAAQIDTSLRGIDSHGVGHLPIYLERADKGVLKLAPDIRIERRAGVLAVDADCAFGHVAGMRALDAALALASEQGVAAASIARVGHMAALGYFARRAAEEGAVALVMQNGPPLMALEGWQRRAIGNNPLAFGAPVEGGEPLVFDMASSVSAYSKMRAAAAAGAPLAEGLALDAQGRPTTDAAAAVGGMLLPVAGAKGMGLAMIVEILAGSLSGVRPVWPGELFGAFLLVIRPEAFADRAAFNAHVADWVAHYRASGEGASYPGERSAAIRAQRLATGIPLLPALHETFRKLGAAAGIPFPDDRPGR